MSSTLKKERVCLLTNRCVVMRPLKDSPGVSTLPVRGLGYILCPISIYFLSLEFWQAASP